LEGTEELQLQSKGFSKKERERREWDKGIVMCA